MQIEEIRVRTGQPRMRQHLASLSVLVVAVLLGVAFASAHTLPTPLVHAHLAPATSGPSLILSWTNTSPLGFLASPCFSAGLHAAMCNATYWVNKDPNGSCALNGTAQGIANVGTSVSTKFYFAGASPIIPSAKTYCGGGSTALTIHLWFYVIPTSGTVTGSVHVYAN